MGGEIRRGNTTRNIYDTLRSPAGRRREAAPQAALRRWPRTGQYRAEKDEPPPPGIADRHRADGPSSAGRRARASGPPRLSAAREAPPRRFDLDTGQFGNAGRVDCLYRAARGKRIGQRRADVGSVRTSCDAAKRGNAACSEPACNPYSPGSTGRRRRDPAGSGRGDSDQPLTDGAEEQVPRRIGGEQSVHQLALTKPLDRPYPAVAWVKAG